MITEQQWELAKLIHEAKNRLCYLPGAQHLANQWSHHTRVNYGHCPQPWCDVALAQAEAILGAYELREKAMASP